MSIVATGNVTKGSVNVNRVIRDHDVIRHVRIGQAARLDVSLFSILS